MISSTPSIKCWVYLASGLLFLYLHTSCGGKSEVDISEDMAYIQVQIDDLTNTGFLTDHVNVYFDDESSALTSVVVVGVY